MNETVTTGTDIEKAMNAVIEAQDDYYITEMMHFADKHNKRTDLSEWELSDWNKAIQRYRNALIQGIEASVNELKKLGI